MKKHGLTQEEAENVYKQVKAVNIELQKVCVMLIEAYGWSSKVGELAESFLLTSGDIRNTFGSINVALEKYTLRTLDDINLTEYRIETLDNLPHQMSIEAHEQIGISLINAHSTLSTTSVEVSNKIGKTKKLPKLILRPISKIDSIRSILDGKFMNDEHRGHTSKDYTHSPYYRSRDKIRFS